MRGSTCFNSTVTFGDKWWKQTRVFLREILPIVQLCRFFLGRDAQGKKIEVPQLRRNSHGTRRISPKVLLVDELMWMIAVETRRKFHQCLFHHGKLVWLSCYTKNHDIPRDTSAMGIQRVHPETYLGVTIRKSHVLEKLSHLQGVRKLWNSMVNCVNLLSGWENKN